MQSKQRSLDGTQHKTGHSHQHDRQDRPDTPNRMRLHAGLQKCQWSRDIPSIPEMKATRTRNLSGTVPVQTFEICNKCGLVALTSQEVEATIGYRRTSGKWITQPNCHKCRAEISANPARRTGPNRNRDERGKRHRVWQPEKSHGLHARLALSGQIHNFDQ